MRVIQALSYSCAKSLTMYLGENHAKKYVYYYGFQVFWGAVVKAVLMVGLSLLLGVFIPAMVLLLTFSSLRMFAGGYHMDTYGKCIATSTILFIGACVTAEHTYAYWTLIPITAFLIFVIFLSWIIIRLYAPKDTFNRPINSAEEIKKFKILSFAYLTVWAVVMAVLAYFDLYLYVIASSFGLLLELFSITPSGTKFFDWVKNYKLIRK